MVGFILTVFSGFRLAKFNIDKRQSNSFIGLPTPACTLFFLTIPLIWINENPDEWAYKLTLNKPLIISFTLFFSYLLIAELPLLALKFKGFSLNENKFRYALLFTGVTTVIILKYLAIPIILSLYILLSLLENIINSK